jgi:glycosyltransferase involved in cell wall biosynthesis
MGSRADSGKNLRIGLISPIFPFRGGISQYSTQLLRALKKKCTVDAFSFKRLYPAFIYPGASQFEPYSEGKSEPGVLYSIDAMNPVSWIRIVQKMRAGPEDLVILPWWSIVHFPWTFTILWMLKLSGIPVFLICHNVADHDSTKKRSILLMLLLMSNRRFLVHCEGCAGEIRHYNPHADIRILPIPVYDQYPIMVKNIDPGAPLSLLFFGIVRPYKGLWVLIEAMRLLKGENICLNIVGEWWQNDPDLREKIKSDPRIRLVDRYVSDQEAGEFFSMADAVILPYHSATGSAVAALAVHYQKPVIYSRIPSMTEMAGKNALWGLSFDPDNSADLARAIGEISEFIKKNSFPSQNFPDMSWDSMASEILGIEW